jgi:hypothetical protein
MAAGTRPSRHMLTKLVNPAVRRVPASLVNTLAAQALVAAITGDADILLSLDLSSLGDGSQLPGRAAIINYGQGSTLVHKQIPHTLTRVICVGYDYATYAGQHRE